MLRCSFCSWRVSALCRRHGKIVSLSLVGRITPWSFYCWNYVQKQTFLTNRRLENMDKSTMDFNTGRDLQVDGQAGRRLRRALRVFLA